MFFRKKKLPEREPEEAIEEALNGNSDRPLAHEEVDGVIECVLRKLKESAEANRDSVRKHAKAHNGASTATIRYTRLRHSLRPTPVPEEG